MRSSSGSRMTEEAGQLAQPVATRLEHDVPGAGGDELRGDVAALLFGRGGESRPQPLARRVDLQLPPRLRIDEEQLAEVGQLLLSRVPDLHGHDLVATAEAQERPVPVAGAAEVGDDDDVRLLAREVADALQCLSDGRCAVCLAPRFAGLSAASS